LTIFRSGWYTQNVNWKRNTFIAIGAISLLTIGVLRLSFNNERRYAPGPRPVFGQRFSSHTLEDDPQYYEKLQYYKENKKPLWKRIFPTKEDMEE